MQILGLSQVLGKGRVRLIKPNPDWLETWDCEIIKEEIKCVNVSIRILQNVVIRASGLFQPRTHNHNKACVTQTPSYIHWVWRVAHSNDIHAYQREQGGH